MKVVNITRVSGDAVIHLRKGKMWPLCDMQLSVSVEVLTRIYHYAVVYPIAIDQIIMIIFCQICRVSVKRSTV